MDGSRRFKVTNKRYPSERVKCDSCDGCGYVTDDKRRIPWTWIERESKDPETPNLAAKHTKVACNKCNGTGTIRYDQSIRYLTHRKKY